MKIAVFDSGFGSISIIREIQKIFKGELIYFADQKNFPYGVKSKKELENIIKDTVDLLEEKFSPDFIIMASNTPTLLLDYSRISRKLAGIYPPLNDAGKISRTRNIAILGTRSVIQSESVTEFIEKCNVPNDIVIHKIDCSLLVELVESSKKFVLPSSFFIGSHRLFLASIQSLHIAIPVTFSPYFKPVISASS